MPIKDCLLALVVVFIWGVNFSFIKIGLEDFPPLFLSALRFALVAVPAVFFVPFPKTSVLNVLGVGLFLGVVKFGLLFVAMDVGVTAGMASLLLQLQVLFTILLCYLFLKESLSLNQGFGLLLSGAGFTLFLLSDDTNSSLLGLVLIMLAALSWAVSNLIMKRTQGVNFLHFMIWVSLIPPIPMFLLSYFLESQNPIELLLGASRNSWLALIYVSFISTLFAFAIWGKLLKAYSASTITPFALLIPVVGIIASSLILEETLSQSEIIGTILIMSGLVFCIIGPQLSGLFRGQTQRESC